MKQSKRRPAMTATAKTIDEYLAPLPGDQRAALQRLRGIIRSAAPGAEECISYQLPAFRLAGRMLVWFGASANHCSLYPGGLVQDFKKELEGFDTSKGTIRFQPDRPLPASLVRKLLKAKLAINLAMQRSRVPTRRSRATRTKRSH